MGARPDVGPDAGPDTGPEAHERGLAVAREAFGVDASRARPLPGDLDRNFLLYAGDDRPPTAVLKVFASRPGRAALEQQRDLFDALSSRAPSIAALLPVMLRQGESEDPLQSVAFEGSTVDAALYRYLPGRPLAEVHPHPPQLLRELGRTLGVLDLALADLSPDFVPPAPASPSWRLMDGPETIAERLRYVATEPRRALLARHLEASWRPLLARVTELPHQLIHHDANDYNVLVEVPEGGIRLSGLIDFGDAAIAPRVGEVAIAAAYAALGKRDPLSAMAHVVAGYHAAAPLSDDEFAVLFELALLRLGTSVAISSERAPEHGGDNDYHQVSAAPAWRALEALDRIHPALATAILRDAAGSDPVPRVSAFQRWARDQSFAPVLGASLTRAPRVDLSLDSPLTLEGGRERPFSAWAAEIEARRVASGAPAAVGFHDEARRLYQTDSFTEAREDGEEPRTVHLGVDLFAPEGTEVFAPLAARVLSVQRNPAPLDYGPTVILEHEGEDGRPFFTLYGHLDEGVLQRLHPGDALAPGDGVGTFGSEAVNGGWPPHLHFQVILHRLDRSGDFPGVAAPTWRRAWTSLCPDPAPLLGLDSCDAREARTGALHVERRHTFCRSMSIHHEADPLQIVRGEGTTLFDAEGRAFLDAVNNVPHVGHCHPRVVAAGQQQMGLLNTNTRYLHEGLHRYAEGLRARLPEGLDVLYFVCSGSEANELALRIARAAAAPGAEELLVQEHGYHGHTGATVEASHYKFAGRGGFEATSRVHVIPIADPVGGLYRGADSGPSYVAEVQTILDELAAEGRAPVAMMAEAIIGCGGQVVPPQGYLRGAFEAVRAAGGLAIADEVQVGFGRVGTHFWAFEEQDARPDIVTMGKPMGNGHPLAAVATTREIADRFAGGMEFFATFGGNHVSAAIGQAVLDVIDDEGLLERARRAGEAFFQAMAPLARRHPVIGDVRGRGLYLGVDLVRDRATREPASDVARYVSLRMRQRGVLIGTDGPHGNVLKIKPPITFTDAEVRRLVATLDAVLSETPVAAPDSVG